MDPAAENYDPEATEDDATCTYPEPAVAGCTDASATNHDPQATEDDGSCVFEATNDTTSNQSEAEPEPPAGTNSTDVNSTDDTTNQSTEGPAMQVCPDCCGTTQEVPANEACPVPTCGACEDDASSSSSSTSETLRTMLIGVVALLLAVLLITGKKPPGAEAKLEDELAQANRL